MGPLDQGRRFAFRSRCGVGRGVAAALVAASAALNSGCKAGGESARWLLNGFVDPTQVGQFLEPRRNEIRSSLSILEEPVGIQDAEEPRPEDLVADFSEHVIGPGDVLTISVFELLTPGQATVQQLQVGTSGDASFPVLGRIKMAGMTLSQLEQELIRRLQELDILPDPEVQVSLNASRATRFSIIGSVARPGSYEVPQPTYRLLSAIADAGGLPPAVQRVYVFRPTGDQTSPSSPATTPATDERREEPVAPMRFSMTDVGGGASTSSAPASSSGPVTSGASASSRASVTSTRAASAPVSEVDELEILEGGPQVEQQQILWDPDRGWIIRPAASAPTSTAESGPATSTSTSASAPSPFEEEALEPLAPPQRIIEIPTKELLAGDPRYNVVVRPNDLINVPPGNVGEYYMMGNVARPGAYDLTGRRLTVKEAIAAAGGFGPLAWPSRADLIRRVSRDEEQVIQLDLDAIFAGNAPDFYLKPNDIVNVGTTAAAPFLAVLRNAFRLSYGFGFVYDRNFADGDTFAAREQVRQREFQEALQRGLPPP